MKARQRTEASPMVCTGVSCHRGRADLDARIHRRGEQTDQRRTQKCTPGCLVQTCGSRVVLC